MAAKKTRLSVHPPAFLISLSITLFSFTHIVAQVKAPEFDGYGRWVNGVTEPWRFPDSATKETITEAQVRWANIHSELRAAHDNPWKGNYFIGTDTHGSYLRLSPSHSFVLFHVDKCQATVMGLSFGKVIFSDSLIQLVPEKTESFSPTHGGHSQRVIKFLPVIWRGVEYLVPENEISDFGDYVAGLGKYNDWAGNHIEIVEFFARIGEQEGRAVDVLGRLTRTNADKKHYSDPLMPPGYERFVKKPINARITARNRSYTQHDPDNEWWDKLITQVSIDAGASHGVKEKMILRLLEMKGFGGQGEVVRITKVGLRSAQGIIERPVRKRPCVKFDSKDDCQSPEYEPVRVGTRVTTNPVIEDPASDPTP